jgi:diguanylate cyclase (GGDEF)-like protein
MTMFKPSAIRDNPYPPAAAITDLLIFNESIRGKAAQQDVGLTAAVSEAKTITLSPLHTMFSVEFSVLHFADPQRNRYAYKLEGFDRDWVTTGSDKRYATYTNLDPGRYLFRVKTANKDGIWNEAGASLEIIITPPYWKTWWFRLLMAMLLLGCAYGMYRVRIRQLARQKAMLSQQVAERTAEVVRQKEEIEHQKESIELAHRNISLLSDIGREITATLDHEAIMLTLYRHVSELMPADVVGVAFYRPEQQVMECLFAMENGKRSRPYTRSIHDPNQFSVWCITHRQEVFINDLDAEYMHYIDRSGLDTVSLIRFEDGSAGAQPQSLIYVPIVVEDRAIGTFSVQSPRKHAYQQVHLNMVRTLVSYGAVAFDNASAYRQLEASLKALGEAQAQLVEKNRELENAYKVQEQRSLTDPLTGLRNRRFLLQHLDTDIALTLRRYEEWLRGDAEPAPKGADLVFFMVDIDHFKEINDRFGHAAGDQVLVQMRARLLDVFRESDYLVRWGGEEFLVVARSTDRNEADAVATRICEAVSAYAFDLDDGLRIARACSVGYACFPFKQRQPRVLSWPQVVELADQALYRVKRGGRNGWAGLLATDAELSADAAQRLVQSPQGALDAGELRLAAHRTLIESE